ESPIRERLYKDHKDKFPEDVQGAVDTPPGQRTALQWQLALKAAPQLQVTRDELRKAMKPPDRERCEALDRQLAAFKALRPAELPRGIGIPAVGRPAPPPCPLPAGVYAARMEGVQPGSPPPLDPRPPQIVPPPRMESTGRRSALANWIASPE